MKFGATAGAGVVVARGAASFEDQRTAGEKETLERAYDPLWTNARTLLDFLDERNMIRRGLADASIGQFVLVKGRLMVLDLAMLKNAWASPAIQKKMLEGASLGQQQAANRHQRRSPGHSQNQSSAKSEMDLLVALLSLLPHTLQCRLIGDDTDIWCSIDEDFVVGKSSDLGLKHGALLQGEWSMLGVLDAQPDVFQVESEEIQQVLSELAGTPIGQLSVNLAPAARKLLGRPPQAFGMTPLLIFRAVTG